ncbi:MAG: purine-cytosine permease [Peltula sp. TS41687]|nr:MAG: purine-cytosine permease [Peltula sp. TS41687]
MTLKEVDVENGIEKAYTPDSGSLPEETFGVGDNLSAKLQRFAGKCKIEQRGVERVLEHERTDRHSINACTMWLSANMSVNTLALGALAPVFGLGYVDAVLTIFFFNIFALFPVAFFSSLGPHFGLRQMVISRFWFGYHAVKIVAFLNIIACVGWSAINILVGAQILHAINNDVPSWAGILVFTIGTFIVTLFGYNVVHFYERWSWIPAFTISLIILGEFARSGNFANLPMGSGKAEAAGVLSFGATIVGYAISWASVAADYTCYQPVDRNRLKIFLWTYLGTAFPLCFLQMLGAALITATTTNPAYEEAYKESSVGGLLGAVLIPPLGNFGRFCLVVLSLSVIANNCPNIYSVSMSLQLLARQSQRVPRFVWSFIATLVVIGIAIPAYSNFVSVLQNFLLIIGYWLAIYVGVAFTEHFVFKRGLSGYVVQYFDKPGKLPPGFAALTAIGFGVFGAVMGLAQAWYVGPIGKKIGLPGVGGDVGFELAFGFTTVSYLVLRWVERRRFGSFEHKLSSTMESRASETKSTVMDSDEAPSPFRPALLIIDVQEDFCPPNGSLAVPNGRSIIPTINTLLSLPFLLKIATKDFHPADHISFATNHRAPHNQPFISHTTITNPSDPSESYSTRLWPVHCVQGTPGAELLPDLHLHRLDHVVEKGQDRRVEMYSAFSDPFGVATSALAGILRDAGVSHVFVVGLAFDYCVLCSARDARKEGFETFVVREGTRAVEPGEGWERAERELGDAGVGMVALEGREIEWVRRWRG